MSAPARRVEADGVATMVAGWREGLARLDPEAPPRDWPPAVWKLVIAGSAEFLLVHGEEAARLGYTAGELWGVHPAAPLARYDAQGLCINLAWCGVTSLSAAGATVRLRGAGHSHPMTWRRPSPANASGAVLLGELEA